MATCDTFLASLVVVSPAFDCACTHPPPSPPSSRFELVEINTLNPKANNRFILESESEDLETGLGPARLPVRPSVSSMFVYIQSSGSYRSVILPSREI